MIRVGICDDDPQDLDKANEMCKKCFQQHGYDSFDIDKFDNPTDMLAAFESGIVMDILLCDIYMPGFLGTEAVRELREYNDTVHVILVTSSQSHAYEAFGLHVDDYLLKPYTYEQFEDSMLRTLSVIEDDRKAAIPVKTKDGLLRMDFSEFCFSETSDHDQVIHLKNGDSITTRATSKVLFERLQWDPRFFKAGSTYIVNLDNIRSIRGRDVEFVNQETITVPMRSQKELSDAFFDRMFEDMK